MHRRTFLAAAACSTVALAGCLGDEEPTEGTSLAALGTVNEDDVVGTIETSGSGTVEEEPDMATMRVSVEETGDEAEEVRTQLAERAETVRDALIDAGIDEDYVITSRYDLGERRRSPGYEGSHRYEVTIQDVDEVGRIVDVAVDAGADDVGRIQFTLSEATREDLRSLALERAVEDARNDAESIAAAKNVEIIGVASVSTDDGQVSPLRVQYDMADETDDAGTEIDEGPVTVSASVTVVYGFE